MKTINDFFELINQKKEENLNILTRERMRTYPSNKRINQLEGKIEAFNELLNEIRSDKK